MNKENNSQHTKALPYNIKINFIRRAIIFLILVYFLIASSMFLDKLELNNDEAIPGIGALALITPNVSVTRLRHVNSLTMFSFHKGKVASFAEALLFLIFGSSVFTLRFAQVLFSLGSLLCIYYICSRNFNRTVGIFTILLLGIDSTFIRATRIGNMQDAILQIFLFWLGLTLIQLYMDKKKRSFLYTAGFIFGVALWAKLMFLGYFFGVLGAFFIFGKKSYVFLRTKVFKKKQDIIVFVVAFMVGCAPLLIFNILNKWPTVTCILDSFKDFSINELGVWNNMNFLHNFKIRFSNFSDLLSSQIAVGTVPATKNNLNPLFFYLSLSAILLYLFFAKKVTLSKRKISFLIIIYGILLCLTSFIPKGGSCDPGHLIILLPIAQIVEALFFSLIVIYLKKKVWAYLIILFMFIPHAYHEFNIMKGIWNNLGNDRVACSSLMVNLSDYLINQNIQEAFCLDHTLVQNIDFISGLKIITWGFSPTEEGFWRHPIYLHRNLPEGHKVSIELVYEYQLKKINPFYMIINKNNDFSENAFQRLKKLIQKDKKQLILIKTFINKPKTRCYELYRVEENGNPDF